MKKGLSNHFVFATFATIFIVSVSNATLSDNGISEDAHFEDLLNCYIGYRENETPSKSEKDTKIHEDKVKSMLTILLLVAESEGRYKDVKVEEGLNRELAHAEIGVNAGNFRNWGPVDREICDQDFYITESEIHLNALQQEKEKYFNVLEQLKEAERTPENKAIAEQTIAKLETLIEKTKEILMNVHNVHKIVEQTTAELDKIEQNPVESITNSYMLTDVTLAPQVMAKDGYTELVCTEKQATGVYIQLARSDDKESANLQPEEKDFFYNWFFVVGVDEKNKGNGGWRDLLMGHKNGVYTSVYGRPEMKNSEIVLPENFNQFRFHLDDDVAYILINKSRKYDVKTEPISEAMKKCVTEIIRTPNPYM